MGKRKSKCKPVTVTTLIQAGVQKLKAKPHERIGQFHALQKQLATGEKPALPILKELDAVFSNLNFALFTIIITISFVLVILLL